MLKFVPTLFAFCLVATASVAQESKPLALDIELNALQPNEGGCRITFLATNNLGAALSKASVETALFDASGAIDRIVTLDFKDLSAGKTKVLQFQLAGLSCTGVGRVLVNDISACEGVGLAATACLDHLKTTARAAVPFGV